MCYNAFLEFMTAVSAVRGMGDVLPDFAPFLRAVEDAAAGVLHLYGYAEIRTPIVERAELFARPLGAGSDVVEKEMFAFADARSGDQLALRPEATASVVRAVAGSEAATAGVARVWCGGPMFRRERPQKGRQRQFHQVNAEAVGAQSPAIDAEQIILLDRLWKSVGVRGRLVLEINNLGGRDERARHREKLSAYFRKRESELDETSRRRIETNPLRILDSKNPDTLAVAAEAPALADELGSESRAHLDAVREKISAAGVDFSDNPMLVRGLDYYNLTVFEWSLKDDSRRQNVLCGGGRYDGLAETIGAKPAPGCGFAVGVERAADLMRECGLAAASPAAACRMICADAASAFADAVAEKMRDAGVSVFRQVTGGNFSRQMKKAASADSPVVVIVGEDELQNGQATLRRLSDGKQLCVAPDNAGAAARELLTRKEN